MAHRAEERDEGTEPAVIPAGSVVLDAVVGVPGRAKGAVVFAHGSGSGRHSPRNRFVARALRDAGLATVLADLLTPQEEADDIGGGRHRFNILLLAERLVAITDWVLRHPPTEGLPVGYFGASTGAAAALVAAVARAAIVGAIVSRGGRPDLAGAALEQVRAPCLLIVGGRDVPVLDLNRRALEHLHAEQRLAIIPGATHLFEEPGALDEVARLAAGWFVRYLASPPSRPHEPATETGPVGCGGS
jgi:putative phosphoribosyl transferase